MPNSTSFLRQLSGKEGLKCSSSNRWRDCNDSKKGHNKSGMDLYSKQEECDFKARKRVMVVVDDTSHSKHAMMWALSHVTSTGDLLTLLHIIPPLDHPSHSSSDPYLAVSLGSLCKASKSDVEVEALAIQGPKLSTVMSQVKKLDVSVLVLGQRKPISSIFSCVLGSIGRDDFVEECINRAECLTIGVRKQSRGVGGYLISTRWRKNFWLLA